MRGKIEMIDMLGRVVTTEICNQTHQQINVEQLSTGVYTILFISDNNSNRLQARLVITK